MRGVLPVIDATEGSVGIAGIAGKFCRMDAGRIDDILDEFVDEELPPNTIMSTTISRPIVIYGELSFKRSQYFEYS